MTSLLEVLPYYFNGESESEVILMVSEYINIHFIIAYYYFFSS